MLASRAVETRAPDPARYAGQQSIEIKATVLPELYVSLNNARSLMGVPGLVEILVCGISKCAGRHAVPHDVCANGKIGLGSLRLHPVYCG